FRKRTLGAPAQSRRLRTAPCPRSAWRYRRRDSKERRGARAPARLFEPALALRFRPLGRAFECPKLASQGGKVEVKSFEHADFEQSILRAAKHFRARGLRPAIIEKDYYVTEALRIVAGGAGRKRNAGASEKD